jgi:hypothetical protein
MGMFVNISMGTNLAVLVVSVGRPQGFDVQEFIEALGRSTR